MNKRFQWDNVWLWGIFFFMLLVGVNWLLFYSYQQSAKELAFWVQFWNYCGTDAFKSVTISLVVPLILAVMGGIFKIGNAVEERVRGAQDKRIEAQQKCIEQTSKMFNKLDDLTSKVRHFKRRETKGETSITDIILELEQFLSEAGSIVSMWLATFPNLSGTSTGSFLEFVNTLYNASASVAYYILHDKGKPEEIRKLQSSLGVIQDSIDYLGAENILKILNYSVEVTRVDLSMQKKKEIIREIDSRIEYLERCASEIKRIERESNELLPSITGEEVEAFRNKCKKALEWKRKAENADKSLDEYPEISNLRELFSQIPREALVNAWEIDYSKESLEKLADWLGSEYMCLELEDLADSP